jgi:hypothetical protein
LYRRESILAIVIFPSQKIMCNVWTYCYRVKKLKNISSSAPGLSVMTLRECCVDRLFPDHVIKSWVRTRPPHSVGMSRLFKTRFLGLTLRHRNAVTWTCDQHARFSFIYIYIDFTLTFCNYIFWSLE